MTPESIAPRHQQTDLDLDLNLGLNHDLDLDTDSDLDPELDLAEQQIQQELENLPENTSESSIEDQPDYRAPNDIVGDIDTSNILTSSRSRRGRRDIDDYMAHYVESEPKQLLSAFTTALNDRPKIHTDDLPAPPKDWNEMLHHPHKESFHRAMAIELKAIYEKGTYQLIERPNDAAIQILPLKWIYTYKFDEDGFLTKHKARICVRGDLQRISPEEKRAATLATNSARAILALVAAFDLDMRQFDAVNAFLNSTIDEEVYTWMPKGFTKPNMIWKLQRALYGLRKSPRLWQKEATRVLLKLNLQPIPEDPCVFVTHDIIIFFYVDDIIIVNHPSAHRRTEAIIEGLHKHWELRSLGEARWFLNIRILRDREAKKLWLCQDSYIANTAVKYHLTDGRKFTTPLIVDDLKPYDGKASKEEVLLYQQKVGSAQYATTITRPDAAKATSKLAEFLMNPSPNHMRAIDRVIAYLYHSRHLAIEYRSPYGDQDQDHDQNQITVKMSSDASFADHQDRRSSHGYVCQLYGGPIDWKASKQRTVTTSTTEAEFLAVSEAGKTLIWWKRILDGIGFKASHLIPIQCDNSQTVRLLTIDDAAINTKLRHVDIHRHWMREKIQNGDLQIEWVPTAEMIADGLTKPLPRQKHQHFVELLRLRDIGHLIDE
jgi:hypothetical protein